MVTLDLKKMLKPFYASSAQKIDLVKVPQFNFVMVDGRSLPGETFETSSEFQQAIGALYSAAYTLKFMSKQRARNPINYPVMPLEGLWWTDSGDFDMNHPEEWNWTLMVLQPKHISPALFRHAISLVSEKRGVNPLLPQVRLAPFREGLCLQTLHIGPYADEPRTIEKIKMFADENAYALSGKHHEIYLGDPRRAKPDRLRTLLRHPVVKV